jgi:DNA-directed RNA polymerase omega subunit
MSDDKVDGKNVAQIDSKFRRVLVASARAEQIMRGARPKIETGKMKPTRVAMEELSGSLVEWSYEPPAGEAEEGAEAKAAEEQPAEVH